MIPGTVTESTLCDGGAKLWVLCSMRKYYFLTTFWALRIVRLRSRSITYDSLLIKAGDPPHCTLYLLLLGGAESGNALLFLATLRGAFCVLSLNRKFLSKGEASQRK